MRPRRLPTRHDRPRSILPTPRVWGALGAAAVAVLGLDFAARTLLYLNLSASLPIGVYRRVGGAPKRGDIVVACLDEDDGRFARERGYVWSGSCPGRAAPIGKFVLAEAGDTVTLTASGFAVNGRLVPHTEVVTTDRRRRAVPHVPFGRYVVAAGQVWLYSPRHALSFDSRYFGAIASRGIQARVLPLWTATP